MAARLSHSSGGGGEYPTAMAPISVRPMIYDESVGSSSSSSEKI